MQKYTIGFLLGCFLFVFKAGYSETVSITIEIDPVIKMSYANVLKDLITFYLHEKNRHIIIKKRAVYKLSVLFKKERDGYYQIFNLYRKNKIIGQKRLFITSLIDSFGKVDIALTPLFSKTKINFSSYQKSNLDVLFAISAHSLNYANHSIFYTLLNSINALRWNTSQYNKNYSFLLLDPSGHEKISNRLMKFSPLVSLLEEFSKFNSHLFLKAPFVPLKDLLAHINKDIEWRQKERLAIIATDDPLNEKDIPEVRKYIQRLRNKNINLHIITMSNIDKTMEERYNKLYSKVYPFQYYNVYFMQNRTLKVFTLSSGNVYVQDYQKSQNNLFNKNKKVLLYFPLIGANSLESSLKLNGYNIQRRILTGNNFSDIVANITKNYSNGQITAKFLVKGKLLLIKNIDPVKLGHLRKGKNYFFSGTAFKYNKQIVIEGYSFRLSYSKPPYFLVSSLDDINFFPYLYQVYGLNKERITYFQGKYLGSF